MFSSTFTRRIAVVGAAIVLTLGLGAGTAFAGEVTGNGKPTAAPIHANSICAFSGQNDFEPPEEVGRTAEHVQNWGQIDKETRETLTTIGLSPGQACRGNAGAEEPGG